MSDLTRRDVLRKLASTIVAAGLVDRVAAQEVHHLAFQATQAAGGTYVPVALSAHEYQTLVRLADLIVPVENGKPGAVAAGAPEWIDMLIGVNDELKASYVTGLTWIDAAAQRRGAADFVRATAAQQTAILDQIAFRRNTSPDLAPGIQFFALVRRMTVDGFYTSRIGMPDIYLGNTARSTFTVPQEAIDYALRRSGL